MSVIVNMNCAILH